MRGLDQDHAARIEAEGVESMAMQTAVIPQSKSRHDEEDLFPPSLWVGRGVVR